MKLSRKDLPAFVREGRNATPDEILDAWPELRQKLAEMGYADRPAQRQALIAQILKFRRLQSMH